MSFLSSQGEKKMVIEMKPPCEIIVGKILPTIRAAIVKVLVKEGMQQKEIAAMLGITQASVSQYINAARGGDKKMLEMFPEIERYAVEMTESIKRGESETEPGIYLCKICKKIRSDKRFREYHKQFAQLHECGVC
jgi:hypothetical protein